MFRLAYRLRLTCGIYIHHITSQQACVKWAINYRNVPFQRLAAPPMTISKTQSPGSNVLKQFQSFNSDENPRIASSSSVELEVHSACTLIPFNHVPYQLLSKLPLFYDCHWAINIFRTISWASIFIEEQLMLKHYMYLRVISSRPSSVTILTSSFNGFTCETFHVPNQSQLGGGYRNRSPCEIPSHRTIYHFVHCHSLRDDVHNLIKFTSFLRNISARINICDKTKRIWSRVQQPVERKELNEQEKNGICSVNICNHSTKCFGD